MILDFLRRAVALGRTAKDNVDAAAKAREAYAEGAGLAGVVLAYTGETSARAARAGSLRRSLEGRGASARRPRGGKLMGKDERKAARIVVNVIPAILWVWERGWLQRGFRSARRALRDRPAQPPSSPTPTGQVDHKAPGDEPEPND